MLSFKFSDNNEVVANPTFLQHSDLFLTLLSVLDNVHFKSKKRNKKGSVNRQLVMFKSNVLVQLSKDLPDGDYKIKRNTVTRRAQKLVAFSSFHSVTVKLRQDFWWNKSIYWFLTINFFSFLTHTTESKFYIRLIHHIHVRLVWKIRPFWSPFKQIILRKKQNIISADNNIKRLV